MESSKEVAGFARRFLDLTGGYWSGPDRWKVRLLSVALLALTVVGVVVPVLINLWSQRFFDALEQRSMDRFMTMIVAIIGIIALNILNTVLHLRVKRRLQLGWRAWLTEKLLDDWVSKGRQHQVTYLPGDHDNPDGRIAEDIRISTEYAIDLGLSLIYCVLLLASFTSILWELSGAPEVTVFGYTVTVPGYLLYVALLYAGAGTTIAMLMGQPLVHAANRRQGYEADFRFGLARVREHAQAVALLHGEGDERRRLFGLFQGVRQGWHRQTRALSNMMTFTSAYSVLSTAFPILVAAPRYISGAISLGVLMQTAQAFQQTVAALSWPIDNLPRVAEWKASVERVLGLHDALKRLDAEVAGNGGARILVERLDTEHNLSFRNVAIAETDGRPLVEPFDLEIRPGERVLIAGDAGAAIRLFRAVARVWTWGSGRISLPAHTRVFFMPQRPYLPHGSLRAALSYPGGPEKVDDGQARDALARVGLTHLLPRLDDSDHWDEIMALPEQQRLGFARLLIRRPDWIFVEHATDALDPDGEEDMLRLLDAEFPAATLLTIGSHPGLEAHHRRKVTLERTGDAVRVRDERLVPLEDRVA
ncbi:ABC transporter ATP-binding protein/permease [Azospirillum halopraeferens]|uniref:ABC transporter ATP-binding protein/permease n=1 Tax=Azospirillum halopraeferens TaxID=34010 RepID=UPI0003FBBF99|nr:ABC transporter ATP-binding protein/permease [Azospirillum halopraeferens]